LGGLYSYHSRNKDYLGYYEALELDPYEANSQHDIKKSFHKAVNRWHPDKHKDETIQKSAKQAFQKIMKAYNVLRHPSSRKKYDAGEWSERKSGP